MATALRTARTATIPDNEVQAALDNVVREIEVRGKHGTDTPDNNVSGKVYFKLSATTSGRWTKVDEVWVAT
jgi:hypothetical protein